MRSSSLEHSDPSHQANTPETGKRGPNGAVRFWLIVLSGVVILLLVAVVAALRSSTGSTRNRGPADEAAPGAHPSRDIDRTLNR